MFSWFLCPVFYGSYVDKVLVLAIYSYLAKIWFLPWSFLIDESCFGASLNPSTPLLVDTRRVTTSQFYGRRHLWYVHRLRYLC